MLLGFEDFPNTVYSRDVSYKKPKKHIVSVVVNSSIGPLSLEDIGSNGIKPAVFWGSEVDSIASNISNLSDVENMMNMVAKEISYAELAVPGRTISDKLICMKKKFYQVDGFGRASTPSRFPGIIRSSFTSESSMNKMKELVIHKKIVVNNDLKRVSSHSDKKIVVKEILVNLPKLAVESVFSKFGKIVSIKMQLIGLWQKALVEFELSEIADLVAVKWSVFIEKNFVCVAKAVDDKQS
ncbi:hypothetical protein G9A89_004872 [Geosiphon pyriformis]|nr:hypothetical protein G9A89_004872 [Geosiphon pyriformis]